MNLFFQLKVSSLVKIILTPFKMLRECSLCNVNFHKARLVYSFHFGIDKARQAMALWRTLLKTNIELRNERVEKEEILALKNTFKITRKARRLGLRHF